MNPTTAMAIAQAVAALIEIWRQHAGKPEGWTPNQQDWADLLTLNEKTAEQYKREAADRLGITWPPAF